MNKEQLNRITEFLAKQGLYIDGIDKRHLNQLIIIDNEIQNRLALLDELKKKLDANAINIASISKSINIARKTIYNNQLLKKYIEKYSIDSQKEIEKYKFNNLVSKIGEYAKELRLLQQRDVDNENLRYENKKLLREIKLLNDKIETLENSKAECENLYKN